jgi:hypothetical protein
MHLKRNYIMAIQSFKKISVNYVAKIILLLQSQYGHAKGGKHDVDLPLLSSLRLVQTIIVWMGQRCVFNATITFRQLPVPAAGLSDWANVRLFGDCLPTLSSFMKIIEITQIFGLPFLNGKRSAHIFTKNVLGYILGDSFTDPSGHPDRSVDAD